MTPQESRLVAGVILAAFALAGWRMVRSMFEPVARSRNEQAARRARLQAEVRGLILDASRLDDPVVRGELLERIAEYRRSA